NLDRLNVLFALPTIFEKKIFSQENFQEVALGPLNSTLTSISYNFELSPLFRLEPMVTYYTRQQLEDQWQVYGTVHYKDLFWVGANYTDGYGSSVYGGIQISNLLKVGYSFDFATNDLSAYNSHEFYLSVRLGNKKVDRSKNYISQNNLNDEQLPQDEDKENDEVIEDNPELTEAAIPKERSPEINTSSDSLTIPESTVSIKPESDLKEEVVVEQANVESPIAIPNTEEDKNSFESSMAPGFYVVVGAFLSPENANKFIEQLKNAEYDPSQAYRGETEYHYVYLMFTENRNEAEALRDELRSVDQFKFSETWILEID
ncbi:type IX secretion system membrane protein PorP/SprF, partial [Fulvivirga sp. RKSG066]|uniref:PorP/SprF family type IX secretion system membrane protein n=1 Tax=Fulvivirga aurantia TaxID=2529383 RepID=UPI0012BD08D8